MTASWNFSRVGWSLKRSSHDLADPSLLKWLKTKERYSKSKTGLNSATTGVPSHDFSLPSICSQYSHRPTSDTVAMTD